MAAERNARDTSSDPLRERLVLALDMDDIVAATRLLRELRPWFGVVKVGLELFTATGPDAVLAVAGDGFKVFVDLKLHDIPTTVGRTAAVVGALGASYLSMHAAGGPEMLSAGVHGLAEGARRAGLDPPVALAVTILTSEARASATLLAGRVAAAVEAGCGGVVCAASDAADVKALAPQLLVVVPGIRLSGGDVHDQARPATPSEALAAGADLLVVGRAVTAAADPRQAAAALVASLG
jgi:orotidine-5'-phosphate decarboxylase